MTLIKVDDLSDEERQFILKDLKKYKLSDKWESIKAEYKDTAECLCSLIYG